jgi:hypothetical protein
LHTHRPSLVSVGTRVHHPEPFPLLATLGFDVAL